MDKCLKNIANPFDILRRGPFFRRNRAPGLLLPVQPTIFLGREKPSWPPRGPLHPSAVQLSAPKRRDLCQVPLDFVLARKRACPPKGYTYPVILKQQHERENIVAFASICGPSNPLPASRHCERDSSAEACSGILFSLLKGCVLLEHVSLNFASPGLLILDLALHKRKRFASNSAQ